MSSSHMIRASDIAESTFTHRVHPISSTSSRFQLPVGDLTGLTRTGVHLCRLPPHTTSTTLHWHSHEDEWFYILDAGQDAILLTKDDRGAEETTEVVEEHIYKGDFLGFPAGLRKAHAFRTGESELLYLMGGSREPLDVSHYPELGKLRIIDQKGGSSWTIDDANVHQVTKN